jgi:hypothetical protein
MKPGDKTISIMESISEEVDKWVAFKWLTLGVAD